MVVDGSGCSSCIGAVVGQVLERLCFGRAVRRLLAIPGGTSPSSPVCLPWRLCLVVCVSVWWLVLWAAVKSVGGDIEEVVPEVLPLATCLSLSLRAQGSCSISGQVQCPLIRDERAGCFLQRWKTAMRHGWPLEVDNGMNSSSACFFTDSASALVQLWSLTTAMMNKLCLFSIFLLLSLCTV
jgi:hypothetical protein